MARKTTCTKWSIWKMGHIGKFDFKLSSKFIFPFTVHGPLPLKLSAQWHQPLVSSSFSCTWSNDAERFPWNPLFRIFVLIFRMLHGAHVPGRSNAVVVVVAIVCYSANWLNISRQEHIVSNKNGEWFYCQQQYRKRVGERMESAPT